MLLLEALHYTRHVIFGIIIVVKYYSIDSTFQDYFAFNSPKCYVKRRLPYQKSSKKPN